jgi:integrase
VPSAAAATSAAAAAPEVEALIEVAKQNRYGRRDALMILLAFRHGLRAAEVVDLRWEQVDFKTARPVVAFATNRSTIEAMEGPSLHVVKPKRGRPSGCVNRVPGKPRPGEIGYSFRSERTHDYSSSSVFASFRSRVSNPSVNQS